MGECAYVNGTFCDLSEAVVSIEDRGFQFADGVYEVVVARGDRPFLLDEHLARLQRSLDLTDIPLNVAEAGIESMIREGIGRAGCERTLVYVQVTRGASPRSHQYPDAIRPTIVATFKPKPDVNGELRRRGVSVVTVPEIRWSMCEVKSIALLPNILVKNRAVRDGYDDAIFVTAAGLVREATSANVFSVRDGVIITPVTDESILHGVTRLHLLDLARAEGRDVRETELTVDELQTADEAFLSSTSVDVLSITQVNNQPIGDGTPGPLAESLYRAFVESVRCDGVDTTTNCLPRRTL